MGSHEVVIVDKNEEAISNISTKLDVLAINGDGKNLYLYQELDKNIDIFIAVTNSDETNLLSCLIVDEVLQVRKKIVRLKNSFFNSDNLKEKLKLSSAIFPINETLQKVKRTIDNPYARSIKTIDNSTNILSSFRIKKVDEISQDEFLSSVDERVFICGVERDGEFFIPTTQTNLQKNDYIYLLAKPKEIEILGKIYDDTCQTPTNCVIFGADDLGIKIAQLLIEHGINIRVYEKDISFCKKAQESLGEGAQIYHTTYGIDHEIKTDDTQNIDMLIATTNDDEFNVAKCLEAKSNGISKVFCINNDIEYISLLKKSEVNVIRGTKSTAYYSILEKLDDVNLVLQKRFCGKNAIMLIRQTYGLISSGEIKDFTPKISSLGLFCIVRNDEILYMQDNMSIAHNDILLAFCKSESANSVKKWLEKQF